MFPGLPRPKEVKEVKMGEKKVEVVKVEKKKALLVKKDINPGKWEKVEKVTKDAEAGRKKDGVVEKKKYAEAEKKKAEMAKEADKVKKVEKRKETQKRKKEEKKKAGEWTKKLEKVDSKGFPLVTVYPSLPKKSRSQLGPDGSRWFQHIKRRTMRSKVKSKDSPTPEEREELVLKNNPFWIPKNTLVEKTSISQLDGNDSCSESEDDEAPKGNKRVPLRRKGVSKKQKRDVSEGEGVVKKVLIIVEEEVEKIIELSSAFPEMKQINQNKQKQHTTQKYHKTKKHHNSHNTQQTTLSGGEEESKKSVKAAKIPNSEVKVSCPKCSIYATCNVKNMKRHLERHKLSKIKVQGILETVFVPISSEDIHSGIEVMQFSDKDEDEGLIVVEEEVEKIFLLSSAQQITSSGGEEERKKSEDIQSEIEGILQSTLDTVHLQISSEDIQTRIEVMQFSEEEVEKILEFPETETETAYHTETPQNTETPQHTTEDIQSEIENMQFSDEDDDEGNQGLKGLYAQPEEEVNIMYSSDEEFLPPSPIQPEENEGRHQSHEQKIAMCDREIQKADAELKRIAGLREEGNLQQKIQIKAILNLDPADLVKKIKEVMNKSEERDEKWVLETEGLERSKRKFVLRRQMQVVLQNQQKSRTQEPPTMQETKEDQERSFDLSSSLTGLETETLQLTETQQHTETPQHAETQHITSSSKSAKKAAKKQRQKQRYEEVKPPKCHICKKSLARKSVLKKHYEGKHPDISREEIENHLKTIKRTTQKCTYCHKSLSDIWKHLKTCTKKKQKEEDQENKQTNSQTDKAEETINIGDDDAKILRLFKEYLNKAKSSENLYTSSARRILRFWKEHLNLDASFLFSPLEKEICYPDVDLLLKQVAEGSRVNIVKSYMSFSAFVKHSFKKKYSTSEQFDRTAKLAFQEEIKQNVHDASKFIKGFNRAAQMTTQKNKEIGRKDLSVLSYRPSRCNELFLYLKNSNQVKDTMNLVSKGSMADFQKADWDEVTARNFLLGMLIIFCGGQRPHVPARMTIKEFKEAAELTGMKVVYVNNHKTQRHYGSAPLPFFLGGLYEACQNYLTLFKSEEKESAFLFATPSGTETAHRNGMAFLAKEYLSEELHADEIKHFNPKIWRTYFSNLNRSDDEITNVGLEVMQHSATTDIRNYNENEGRTRIVKEWSQHIQQLAENTTYLVNYLDGPERDIENREEQDSDAGETEDQQEQDTISRYQGGQNLHNKDLKMSEEDRRIFRKHILPTENLKRQIESAKKEHADFMSAYQRLLKRRNTVQNAHNTIRKCTQRKTKEETKKANASRTRKRQESRLSKTTDD